MAVEPRRMRNLLERGVPVEVRYVAIMNDLPVECLGEVEGVNLSVVVDKNRAQRVAEMHLGVGRRAVWMGESGLGF